MLVKENISFRRGQDPKISMNLGISSFMWFSRNHLGIEFNDGDRNMYISEDFGNDILEGSGWKNLKSNFQGNYKRAGMGPYICNYHFKLSKMSDNTFAYYVAGSGGSYGFNTGWLTKKETFGKRIRKTLYDQLYEHLLKYLPKYAS